MASHPGVESERLPFHRQARFLDDVLRVEPTDHPAFPLDDGQPHDHREPAFLLSSGLVQPRSTLRLIVLVPYQQHAGQVGERVSKVEDRSAGGSSIGLGRLPVEEPDRVDPCVQSRLLDSLSGQRHPARFPKPGPLVLDQVFLHPVDGLHQHPIRELRSGLEISRSLVHDSEPETHDPAPLVTIREPAEHLLQEGACSKQ